MNAYGYRENMKVKRGRRHGSAVARLLRAVFEVVCERITAANVRMAAVLVGFFVALGIVGGMESGAVSLYVGLPVCLAIAASALLMHFDD